MSDRHTRRSNIVFASTAVVAVIFILALLLTQSSNKDVPKETVAPKEATATQKDVVQKTVIASPANALAKPAVEREQSSIDDALLLKVFHFFCWDANDPVWKTEEHKTTERNLRQEIIGRDVLWHVKVIDFNNPDYNGFTIILVVPDAPHEITPCEYSTIEVDYDSRLPRYQPGVRLTVRGTISDVFPVRVNAHELSETKR